MVSRLLVGTTSQQIHRSDARSTQIYRLGIVENSKTGGKRIGDGVIGRHRGGGEEGAAIVWKTNWLQGGRVSTRLERDTAPPAAGSLHKDKGCPELNLTGAPRYIFASKGRALEGSYVLL